jgi:hypothetical protein
MAIGRRGRGQGRESSVEARMVSMCSSRLRSELVCGNRMKFRAGAASRAKSLPSIRSSPPRNCLETHPRAYLFAREKERRSPQRDRCLTPDVSEQRPRAVAQVLPRSMSPFPGLPLHGLPPPRCTIPALYPLDAPLIILY